MKISAVIVTRGDRDISEVIENLACGFDFDELIIWDNSKSCKDLKVFGRFAGAFIARNDLVYVQDDDCIVATRDIAQQHADKLIDRIPQTFTLVNFPEHRRQDYSGTGIALLGWGTIFHKYSLDVFEKYLRRYPMDDLFLRECDRVFSYFTRNHTHYVEVPMRQLPYAFGGDRMGTESRHGNDLRLIRERLQSIEEMIHA